jgi:putative DNA primase/helicase
MGQWFRYDGARWRKDDTLHAFDLARRICREASAECNGKEGAKAALASARTVAAVERLARSDRRIAATVDQWDADPWLLNTPDGVIDLRTGHLRPHLADDYMTKITATGSYGDCLLFLAFLDKIMGGDAELIAFIRRALGYAVTGLTREHALFFGYGTGANGKSVLLSTVASILGDYHKTAPIETFTVSGGDRHPTDIAMLRGARLVTATETEEGREWAEARIKQLTGGDRVSARFMRQDFFEFIPQFKLFVAGNHRPGLRSVDEAIRRRLYLTPFAVTIPPDERDADLAEKLKAEWPGILAWIIKGCIEWQAKGLAAPKAVTAATAEYLESEDALAAWIDERCERDPRAWASSSALFVSWAEWATAAGEATGSQKKFSQKLADRKFQKHKMPFGAGFYRLRLTSRESDAATWDCR